MESAVEKAARSLRPRRLWNTLKVFQWMKREDAFSLPGEELSLEDRQVTSLLSLTFQFGPF